MPAARRPVMKEDNRASRLINPRDSGTTTLRIFCAACLTLSGRARKKFAVPRFPDNFYARWRKRSLADPVLRENDESFPSEHLLQIIWQQQRLLRHQLMTLDGQTARI